MFASDPAATMNLSRSPRKLRRQEPTDSDVTTSYPGGGYRRIQPSYWRPRRGPHACEPASLLGRWTARNDAAACQDEPIVALFFNSQDSALTRNDGFVAHVFRDNGAAAQCASGNMGRLPDDDFCADLDAVVEVDHVGVIETKASR